MLALSIGKIIKNKWLFLCLFLACVFSVALIAAIPAYENAMSRRILQQEFREIEAERNRPPLLHTVSYEGEIIARYGGGNLWAIDSFVQTVVIPRFDLPVVESRATLTRPNVNLSHIALNNEMVLVGIGGHSRGTLVYSSGFFDHVELVAGRFPSEIDTFGEIEVVVSERAAIAVPFMLDSRYALDFSWVSDSVNTLDGIVRFRVVGVVREIDPNDVYWRIRPLSTNGYTTYESFAKIFQADEHSQYRATWETVFDHRALDPENIQMTLDILSEGGFGSLSNFNLLRNALNREARLGPFLWVLQMPVLALIVFFIVMLSGLILDHDRVEISLLYSRGAGKRHVFSLYLVQILILAALGIFAGIPLSLFVCRVVGAAAGFLEFAGRAPLDVRMNVAVLQYAMFGAGLFVFSTLLPILFSSSIGIVRSRRQKAARGTKPFFEKYFLDVILIAISAYGYFSYQNLQELLQEIGGTGSNLAIDPLIFLISTFFFIGCAMIFTRLYPYIVRLLFILGKSVWPPAIYASLSAARSRPRSRYIMLFIIMTVSIGIFAAAAARTINQNHIDRAMYDIGADLIVTERWAFVDPDPVMNPDTGLLERRPEHELLFTEPPFEKWGEAEGVALATPVYRNDRAVIATPRRETTPGALHRPSVTLRDVNVMAIYPDEFAKTAWWRDDMFDYHFNHMMNAMSENPNAVLLSRPLMERLNIHHGEDLRVTWANHPGDVVVYFYDALDLFPAWNPLADGGSAAHLIIMNYELVRAEFRIEPYEVWITKEEGASSTEILRQYTDNEIPILRVADSQAAIANLRNEPLMLSMNGFLTLTFVMILSVTVAGFLVFWFFELKSRQLQISIMRSMGMTKGDVALMLLWEQVLLSIIPLIAGLSLGAVGSSLFVPMFEMGEVESPLPFLVFSSRADSLRIGFIVFGSIVLASVMLWYIAARINISKTLKLGEE